MDFTFNDIMKILGFRLVDVQREKSTANLERLVCATIAKCNVCGRTQVTQKFAEGSFLCQECIEEYSI